MSSSAATNATATPGPASVTNTPSDLSSSITMLLSSSAILDGLKLLVLGSVLEICRRIILGSWDSIVGAFWITAAFDGYDECYLWMLFWLSKHPSFGKARSVQVSTRTFGLNGPKLPIVGQEDETDGSRRMSFLPSMATTYGIWYKRRYVTITRDKVSDGYYMKETLSISIMSRDHAFLRNLLLEAKRLYKAAEEHLTPVYVSNSKNSWKHVASLPKRPLRSIVLDDGIKDLVLNDAQDFLQSRAWYAERGIPFRRGYLLHGAPGSGKTSLIQSLAGELGLDIYIISLSRLGLDDNSLSEIIADMPEKCIALIEDIDAAFQQGLKRNIDDPEDVQKKKKNEDPAARKKEDDSSALCRITLSGLLNALDGIGAQEGRILFATTNDFNALDPALSRPGRMDLHVEFKLSSQHQARELFKCFYLPCNSISGSDADTDEEAADRDEKSDDSGYASREASVDGDNEAPPSSSSGIASSDASQSSASSSSPPSTVNIEKSAQLFSGVSHGARSPLLSRKKATELAMRFAEAIPNREFSMASLQGYLMTYKTRPYDAVNNASAWVEKKRAEKQSLRRAVEVKSETKPGPS
ncbi:putative mitochondrial chaperone BCS1-B [Grifola frondosa]|uniref:Putative mitochondrial chaperone BCS1-B n=1 Tax=Grifola frondosa TaxID=5627 RepID=A0A1C7MCV1_GRIFR|nr:putative mitochondrial chaperone BCS1-B [Grifola frondosa]